MVTHGSKMKRVIGWREWVSLPDLGIKKIKVKVDSGARTSALHAEDIHQYRAHGKNMLRFKVAPLQGTGKGSKVVHAEMIGRKVIKSSIGVYTRRPTIRTEIKIGLYNYPIKITLINRDVMGFRMLLGREALRKRFVIDVSRSYLQKRVLKKKSAAKKATT